MPEEPEKVYYLPEDRAHDPREHEEWFLRLPEDAKREFRERWSRDEQHRPDFQAKRRRTLRLYVAEGAFFFSVIFLFFFHTSIGDWAKAILIGAGFGLAAWKVRAGPYQYGILGCLGYMVFHWTLSGGLLEMGDMRSIFAWVATTFIAAAIGVGHVLNRYDMTE